MPDLPPTASAIAAAALLLLAACSSRPAAVDRIYSPAGEPLNGGQLGTPKCADALARWSARVDRDRDGTVSLEELLADAREQFARMDFDRDGSILPAELDRYRLDFALPDQRPRLTRSEALAEDEERRRGISRGTVSPRRDPQLDPVMSADRNFDLRVTEAEWLDEVQERFARLDDNRDGRLTLEELEDSCPKSQR